MSVQLIYYHCPACGQNRIAPASIAGQMRVCYHCDKLTLVPPSSTRSVPMQGNERISSKAKPRTRKPKLKQFGELKAKDFAKTPVWVSVHTVDHDESWYDNSDEQTFRPWSGSLPVSPEDAMFLVAATLATADGREFQGFITPQCAGQSCDLAIIQPQLFISSSRFYGFWHGMVKLPDKDKKRFYLALGKDLKAIFPITFSTEPRLACGTVSGSIPGFCCTVEGEEGVYF
jgi:hypothetical protein